ncbi:phage holin family protein [Aromatoleum buckelii]|uniref:phage holin family protein n=1 Tax=Aromatoleum buckelii TaxID=200254 RepID=UPI001FF48776|nr:phage holin family protein [Aromatoleum buckelii]MCK0509631.1 phage holin family protein [Aromatoleum buckelii]
MDINKETRSLPELFTDLMRETSTLVRKEIDLAKAEMSEKISQTTSALTSLAVGGVIAFAGVLVLLDGIAHAIAVFADIGLWAAALLVGVIVLVIGLVMLNRGRHNLDARNLVPRRTAQSLRRDKEFVKEQTR